MRALAVSIFLGLVFSILNVPLTFAGGWAGNQTYTSFDGKTYNMRVYNGKHVALLIQETHLHSTDWLQINESYGAGPWPGFKEEYLEFLVDKLDAGYEFYTELFGHEPAENPDAPNNLLRVAFVMNAGAGQGIIGMKGIEIGPAYLERSIYAARDGKIQQTIFWHEFGRNFGISNNDFGVKYVLVERLRMPTFMGWEYGVSARQFAINDTYLLPRYYLADPKANINKGYGVAPALPPRIPRSLESESLSNANSSTLRAGMANQYYLENGFSSYRDMVQESDVYTVPGTPQGVYTGLIKFMNERNSFRLDYSFWSKNSKWSIKSLIDDGAQKIVLSQSKSKIGDMLLLGRKDDFVQIAGPGQFRIDAGDGYDVVKLPFTKADVDVNYQSQWKWIITTATSKVVLDFVDQVQFSDGVVIEANNQENALFPIITEVKAGRYSIKGRERDAIKVTFTEPVAKTVPYDWGIGIYAWNLILRTPAGITLSTYSIDSSNTIFDNNNVYFVLPNNYRNQKTNKLEFCMFFNGCQIEFVDRDGNRLSRYPQWQNGFGIPSIYRFDIRSIAK